MKILFTFLTFGKNIFAGMENSLFQLAKGLQASGNDVAVFTSKKYGLSNEIDGIKVYRSDYLPIKLDDGDFNIIKNLKINKEFIKKELNLCISEYKADVIIAWDPLWGFIQYIDFEVHIPQFLCFRIINSLDILQEAEKYNYSQYFGLSNYLNNELKNLGFKKEINLLPNSIDYLTFQNYQNKVPNNIVFCNARLSHEKGINFLIDGFYKFSKHHPNYKLLLCSGEFPFGNVEVEKQKLLKQIHKLNIEKKVYFLPNLDWNSIPKIISKTKVIVLPSLLESFGRAALEALAIGVPIISTNVGNLPDLIGNMGILIPPKNSNEIYINLRKLVEEEEFYNNYKDLGVSAVKKYDRIVVAENFLNMIIGE